MNSQAILHLDQVSLAAPLGTGYLLENISLTLQKRDRAVIIGASGSGKTTLLQLLNRLREPTGGIIYFNSSKYQEISVQQLRQQVVYVSQEAKLLGMSGYDAIAYPLTLQNIPKFEIQQRIKYWQEKLDLDPEWLERGELQLSQGQKQLIAIARSLVMQPQILLLDEPTSALDQGRTQQLFNTLKQWSQEQQTTIIIATHQLEIAQVIANRAIYLQKGKLLEDLLTQDINWSQWQENLMQVDNREEWE